MLGVCDDPNSIGTTAPINFVIFTLAQSTTQRMQSLCSCCSINLCYITTNANTLNHTTHTTTGTRVLAKRQRRQTHKQHFFCRKWHVRYLCYWLLLLLLCCCCCCCGDRTETNKKCLYHHPYIYHTTSRCIIARPKNTGCGMSSHHTAPRSAIAVSSPSSWLSLSLWSWWS